MSAHPMSGHPMGGPTLYGWFAASVDRDPDAVALEVRGVRLTYRELHRCAEVVAGRLLDAHGRPPRRVGLLAARSVLAFAGYLGALRLGAAVVPLNAGYPVQRNRMVCDLAGVDVLLTEPEPAAPGNEGPDGGLGGVTVVRLTDDEVLGATAARLPSTAVPPTLDDIAYLLFTSGSTGRPKGVPIRHRNATTYVAHNIARYRVGPGSRISHTFDLTFDPSVFDLFVTWGGGGTLVSPQRAELLAPVDYLVDRAITHWFSVPSVVSVSADLGNLPAGRATGLRYSAFIGEQLTYRQARAWRAAAPGTLIDNVYGPTELTVACTEYRLPTDAGRWPVTSNDTAPIGGVYEFLDHLILDEHGRPADDGELCVRGAQRFDGYLDPGDNRDRFLAFDGGRGTPYDNRGPLSAAHYYRTGDRVRWESGNLVHLGRLDNQVKVRGHRIELGEIEAALARHPQLRQAVVVATRRAEETELTGCYTGTALSKQELVRWLRRQLPIHMVPRRFQHLDAFPRNANGKVDRAALRDTVLTPMHGADPR